MTNTWPQRLQNREVGASLLQTVALPKPSSIGVLILDDQLTINSLPGGVLNHIAPTDNDHGAPARPVHYLDLSGIQAHSLLDFGGSDEFWAGISKLYASGSGFQSMQGVSKLKNCRYLYLDNCKMPKEELMKLATELPTSLDGALLCLDIRGNPGLDNEVEASLLSSNLFAMDDCYFNGKRCHFN